MSCAGSTTSSSWRTTPTATCASPGEDVPSIKSLDTEGVVVYAGSFSKVISPGMRVGYAIGPKAGPAKDGGVQAGRGCPLPTCGPRSSATAFMTEYDYRGPPGKPAGPFTAGRAPSCWRPWSGTSCPWASPGSHFEGGLFAWCTLPAGVDMPGVLSKRPRSTRCA